MPWGITFSSGPFLHTYAQRRATRWLKEFLDAIGHERLAWAIDNDRSFTSFFPPEDMKVKSFKYTLPKEYLEEFPDVEVYEWIPPEYRSFIEENPKGKLWVFKQLGFIRNMVVTT